MPIGRKLAADSNTVGHPGADRFLVGYPLFAVRSVSFFFDLQSKSFYVHLFSEKFYGHLGFLLIPISTWRPHVPTGPTWACGGF